MNMDVFKVYCNDLDPVTLVTKPSLNCLGEVIPTVVSQQACYHSNLKSVSTKCVLIYNLQHQGVRVKHKSDVKFDKLY